MFLNQNLLVGIYASSSGGFWNFTTPASGTTITAFSVTTTSGTITINWGDNSSNTISSGSLVNKTY